MENVQDTAITEEILETTDEPQEPEVGEIKEEHKEDEKITLTVDKDGLTQSMRKQMTKLRRRAQEAERERDTLREKLKESNVRPERPDQVAYTDQYGSVSPEFNKVMKAYEDKLYKYQKDQETQIDGTQQDLDGRVEDFMIRSEPLREKYSDFVDVVNQKIFRPPLIDALLDSNPELAYYLGNHETERIYFNKISMDNPDILDEELGKIETRLSKTAKQASKAPAPIKPVDESKGELLKDIDEIKNDQAWANARKAQRLRKFRGG